MLSLAPYTREAWLISYDACMSDSEHEREADATPDGGVDVTLIRWMLSLTPAERLQVLQSNIRSLEKLHGAADRR